MPQPVETDGRVAGYKTNAGPVVAYREALSLADAITVSGVLIDPVPFVGHGGFQNLAVSGRFSTGSANVVVYCLRYAENGDFLSASKATLLAGTRREDGGGKFMSDNPVLFDTQGAIKSRIVIEAVSGGQTVDLYVEDF